MQMQTIKADLWLITLEIMAREYARIDSSGLSLKERVDKGREIFRNRTFTRQELSMDLDTFSVKYIQPLCENSMQMQSDVVMVKPIPAPRDGVLIVAGEEEKTQFGEVLHVGPGRKHHKTGVRMPVQVEVGNTVMFGANTGEKHYLTFNEDTLIMREGDIMAIVA